MARRLARAAAVAAVAAGVAAAGISAKPDAREIAAYCSPTGDVCFGIFDRSGAVYLEITTIARYFGRYRVCAQPPPRGAPGAQRCASFPIGRRDEVWGSAIRYGRHFPVVGPGTYRVTWKLGAQPLGRTLRFRLPLAR